VLVLDLTNQKISATISVPEARRVTLNHAGTKILAFADNTNSFFVIDTTANTATPIQNPALLDHPVNAVFTADDSKAYILNCGAECGGTTASVTVFNTSDNSLGANLPVSAATVGLLDNNKLYVAGSANNVGQLDVIDASTFTRVQSGITIANGTHSTIAMADGGNLYVGSQGCNNVGTGCLSVFQVSGQTATMSSVIGDVAAILPLLGRNLVYVAIGRELVIYETSTNQPRPNNQFDVVGTAAGLLRIN
jgi:DNA-binding beta-propeller fold protein YncE